MKRTIIFAFVALFSTLLATAQKPEIFAPEGKAIKGYDPVAFFKDSKPVKGADSLSFRYKEVTWLFSSKDNLEAFKTSPDKFTPRYGGYCAYGASQGYKAPTETETWTIVDEKLYFNYNNDVKNKWSKDQRNLILTADQKWSAIKDK